MSTSDTNNLQVTSDGASSSQPRPPTANATASKRVQKTPMRKRHTPKVYGYALEDAWIIEYAVRHNLGTSERVNVATEKVLFKIMRDTRMASFCTVKCHNGARNTGLCLQLGNSWSRCGMHSVTKEKIETVKRVLETEEEPKWYGAD